MNAYVVINSYAGRLEKPVEILGETPTRYKITVRQTTKLPRRILHPGETAFVPKTAIIKKK